MSSLIPVSAHQVAPYARAAVATVEPAVSSPSEDGRDWARAYSRDESERGAQRRVETLLPPDRSVGAARGAHYLRHREPGADWPSAAFFAQYLSQEALPETGPRVDAAAGAARYPSLGFDAEILPPGGAPGGLPGEHSRVDILV